MIMGYYQSIMLAGLLGCCSGARAESPSPTIPASPRASILPILCGVEVKEVKGQVEYAYDGTGWRPLTAGKQLRPGATVRAASGSAAVLRVEEALVKVSPATSLHITMAAPPEETAASLVAALR
jgi:hypothetical protein